MKENKKKIFPKLKKKITSFLTDESGKITKKDALGLSAGAIILAWLEDVSAVHANSWHASWWHCGSVWPLWGHVNYAPSHSNYASHDNNAWWWHSSVDPWHYNWECIYPNWHSNWTLTSHTSWIVNWHYSWTPNWWTINDSKLGSWHTNVDPAHASHGSHGSHWSHGSHGSHWSRW